MMIQHISPEFMRQLDMNRSYIVGCCLIVALIIAPAILGANAKRGGAQPYEPEDCVPCKCIRFNMSPIGDKFSLRDTLKLAVFNDCSDTVWYNTVIERLHATWIYWIKDVDEYCHSKDSIDEELLKGS